MSEWDGWLKAAPAQPAAGAELPPGLWYPPGGGWVEYDGSGERPEELGPNDMCEILTHDERERRSYVPAEQQAEVWRWHESGVMRPVAWRRA